VLGGAAVSHLTAVANASKSGFETAIQVSGNYAAFELQALDSDGRVIGTSRPFTR
jgi:hypothetical protein